MQKDLFGSAIAATVLPDQSESKIDFLQKYRINLRLDQAIIAALLLVVAYVFVFSFGVESGKRYAMAEIKAERAMRERMARELGEKIFQNNTQAAQTPNTASGIDSKNALPTVKTAEPIVAGKNLAVSGKTPVVTASAIETPAKTKEVSAKIETPSTNPGKFGIQTVTFTSKAAAEKFIKKLAGKGYQSKIIAKGKFQQVCVTGFETKDKAAQAMVRLKTEGLAPKDAYIRPLAA